MNLVKSIAVGATMLVLAGVGSVSAAPVQWGGDQISPVGSAAYRNRGNFDAAEMLFDGFLSDGLTSVTGAGYYHTHDPVANGFSMEALLDGVWTEIFSYVSPASLERSYLDATISGITFTKSVISGLRLSTFDPVNQSFHRMLNPDNNTVFNFTDAQMSAVPLPAALPMLLVGFGAFGFVGARKRKS